MSRRYTLPPCCTMQSDRDPRPADRPIITIAPTSATDRWFRFIAYDEAGMLMGCVDTRAARPALGPGEGTTCKCDKCMVPRQAEPEMFQAKWVGNFCGVGGLHFGGPFRDTVEEALTDLLEALRRVGWATT